MVVNVSTPSCSGHDFLVAVELKTSVGTCFRPMQILPEVRRRHCAETNQAQGDAVVSRQTLTHEHCDDILGTHSDQPHSKLCSERTAGPNQSGLTRLVRFQLGSARLRVLQVAFPS